MKQESPPDELVKSMQKLTSAVWRESVKQNMTIENPSDNEVDDLLRDLRYYSMYSKSSVMAGHIGLPDHIDVDKLRALREKIEVSYLENMITLSTEDLNNILYLHEFGAPYRAERTLEMIQLELTRRGVLNDSSQSDTIYKNVEQRSKTE